MSKSTPVQLTAGTGFGFEDKIAARVFLAMLQGERYFGIKQGVPIRVDFQVQESDWFLDDLLITLADGPSEITNVAISAKTAKQVTGTSGFNRTFREAVWSQWCGAANGPFAREQDLLCLATANVGDAVFKAWNELLKEAIEKSSERFLSRVETASQTKKALFYSLFPDESEFPGMDALGAVALFRQIRLLKFDFSTEPSRDEATAIGLCHQVLRTERTRTASELWAELIGIAKQCRESGGTMDLSRLVTTLNKARFKLAQHPSYANDWATLDGLSMSLLSGIRSDIDHDVTLDRSDQQHEIQSLISSSGMLVILGPSGVGKSAMLKKMLASDYDNVVWMNQGQFDFPDPTHQLRDLDLNHNLSVTLQSSTYAQNVLVIDALESFSDQAIRMFGHVLRELDIDQSISWAIVASCQVHAWSSIQRRLVVESQVHPSVFELQPVGTNDVAHVFEICGIVGISNDPSALRLFTNLKILDWVVRAIRSNPTKLQLKTTSTKIVMIAVWEYWVGNSQQKHVVGQLLLKLAAAEALTFATGLPFDELSDTDLQLLPSLEARDVVRIENDQVFFSHDLIPDWIRLRELCKDDAQPGILRQHAGNPIWHSAIRLFGQTLLDKENHTSNSWEMAQQNVRDGSAAGDIAGDLLLDAVFFHPNAYLKLTGRRDCLLAKESNLLLRITKRFLLVATAAEPLISTLTIEQDMRLLLKTQMRLPFWRSWLPMLKFLHDNLAEYANRLPDSVAKICALWLRRAPIKASDGTAFALRLQVAEIAVTLAREAQAQSLEGTWFQGKDKVFYEAALLAAPDLPDQVAEFALVLSRRKPIGKKLQLRITKHKQKRRQEQLEHLKQRGEKRCKPPPASIGYSFRGERKEPWPLGPSEQVDESFRSVAWQSNGLQALISERPSVAAEIILALSIEAPGYEHDRYHHFEKRGIEEWNVGMPDSYFNGPFLLFLRHDSDTALNLILALVNFATDRWCEEIVKRHPGTKPPSMDVEVESEKRQWFGTWQIYGWFRGGAGMACPVNCSLMALEKWLYEQIENDVDISEPLRVILTGNRSVAIAGLLCEVGKKKPELFSGPLLPLLGDAHIFEWDHALIANNSLAGIGLTSWVQHGELAFNSMRDWHTLRHRRFNLQEIAKMTMLANADAEVFFSDRIQLWATYGAKYEYLCAQLDIRNYAEVIDEDGEPYWEFSYPEELGKKAAVSLTENQHAMQILNLPFQCEKLVESGGALEPEQLEPFLEHLQALAEDAKPDPDPYIEQKKPVAILAGIYLLLSQHRDWLKTRPPLMSWCESILSDVFQHTPEPEDGDSPYSISVTDWESFAGKSAILMLVTYPDSDIWREAAAKSVMAYRYSTTGAVLQTAFSLRQKLGSDFNRLVNLAKLWAAAQSVFARDPDSQRLDRNRGRLVQAFKKQSISEGLLPLSRLAAAGRRLIVQQRLRDYEPLSPEDVEADRERIRNSHVSGLNWMIVQNALNWLPEQLSNYQGEERAMFDDEYAGLLQYCLGESPSGDDDHSDRKVPNEIDRWLLERIAGLAMDLDTATGRALWQPIMDLGIGAHYWVDCFVRNFFLAGSKQADSPDHFMRRWTELIDYTLGSPIWQPQQYRDYRRCETSREVMGLRTGALMVGAIEYESVINSLVGRFEKWAATWLADADAANDFAAFLIRPSAGPLVPAGVKWLANRSAEFSDYDWRERGLETNLATVLQRAWDEFSSKFLTDDTLQSAFFDLLSILVQRQNGAAIVLQGEVGEISPNGSKKG